MKIYTDVDLRYNEIQNMKVQTTIPDDPEEGTIYYSSDLNKFRYYNGLSWVNVGGESGGGGGGEVNVLEGVKINGSSLNITSKNVSVTFSTTGTGDLTIKDSNTNQQIGNTLNIGSAGITAASIIAVGTLTSGYSTYILKHNLGTDNVMVQVIDNNGVSVGCAVTRYTSGSDHLVKLEFSSQTAVSYKVIIVGSPNASSLSLISQS